MTETDKTKWNGGNDALTGGYRHPTNHENHVILSKKEYP